MDRVKSKIRAIVVYQTDGTFLNVGLILEEHKKSIYSQFRVENLFIGKVYQGHLGKFYWINLKFITSRIIICRLINSFKVLFPIFSFYSKVN